MKLSDLPEEAGSQYVLCQVSTKFSCRRSDNVTVCMFEEASSFGTAVRRIGDVMILRLIGKVADVGIVLLTTNLLSDPLSSLRARRRTLASSVDSPSVVSESDSMLITSFLIFFLGGSVMSYYRL